MDVFTNTHTNKQPKHEHAKLRTQLSRHKHADVLSARDGQMDECSLYSLFSSLSVCVHIYVFVPVLYVYVQHNTGRALMPKWASGLWTVTERERESHTNTHPTLSLSKVVDAANPASDHALSLGWR